MKYPSKILENAVSAISTLPGIGKKTALRLALHLIQNQNNKAQIIGQAFINLRNDIKHCINCHSIADHNICDICASSSRDKNLICVVENVRDMMAIEDTGSYNGQYHVLGGLISPIDGIGPNDLEIDSLINRVKECNIKELIMAISPTIEGETTSFYISKKLPEHVQITIIARGVSFGGELEYADELTLGRSISGRVPYKVGV
jgi:recombination protein RecR